MNKALEREQEASGQKLDWRRKVSDHVAFGLLVYTGLHIFVTMTALKGTSGSVLPYFALIVLVAAVIPACRWFEARWDGLSDDHASDQALGPQFRREVMILWLAVLGLPFVLTFGFKAVAALL